MIISFLSVISGDALISAVIWLVVVGLIFFVVQWALSQIPIPAPFNTVVRVILVVIVAIVIINVLLTLAGHPIVRF
jgi:hypothetical protein